MECQSVRESVQFTHRQVGHHQELQGRMEKLCKYWFSQHRSTERMMRDTCNEAVAISTLVHAIVCTLSTAVGCSIQGIKYGLHALQTVSRCSVSPGGVVGVISQRDIGWELLAHWMC